MLEKVVFSERAIVALLTETRDHLDTETGGVFLGYRKGKIWYIVETVDPGPNSTFEPSFFEYDDDYLNHLMNKLNRLYDRPLDIIGLWHRHPGSFDRFSGTDDGTNIKYARRNKDGAISALVNIDPTFRLTIYHVTEPLEYRKVGYVTGDNFFPRGLLTYTKKRRLLNDINGADSFVNRLKRMGGFIEKEDSSRIYDALPENKQLFSLFNSVDYYFREKKSDLREELDISYNNTLLDSNDKVEAIIGCLQADIEYFEEVDIRISLSLVDDTIFMTESGTSEHYEMMRIEMEEGQVYCWFEGNKFNYHPGLFREMCEFYVLHRKEGM